MKIAIATDGSFVSEHFGSCKYFTIMDIEDGKVVKNTLVDATGYQHGLMTTFLATYGVTVVIAGGMGHGMFKGLKGKGFEVFPGISGEIDKVIQNYVEGNLEAKEVGCSGHHDDSHQCGCGK